MGQSARVGGRNGKGGKESIKYFMKIETLSSHFMTTYTQKRGPQLCKETGSGGVLANYSFSPFSSTYSVLCTMGQTQMP